MDVALVALSLAVVAALLPRSPVRPLDVFLALALTFLAVAVLLAVAAHP